MSWLTNTLTSTLGRKVIMALTGIFLILFLAVHLAGNLQLLKNDDGEAFNMYAEFMSTNPLVQFIAKGNFFFILLHVFVSVLLTRKNSQARPVNYQVAVKSGTSAWSSRNMGILGTLILVFLIVHLKGFWYEMHFGEIPYKNYDGFEARDLYAVVDQAFSHWYWVAVYLVGMLAVAFHLSHGFQSAFQTLGLNHVKYSPAIKFVGSAFAILVPAGFAAIPVMMFFS